MAVELTGNVVKGGETCIQTLFSRSSRKHGDPLDWKGGLKLTIKAVPRVEEFMINLGVGELCDVEAVGRYWQPIGGVPLTAYVTQPFMSKNHSDDGASITMDRLGQPLILPGNDGSDRYTIVNLSFLRLRGISDGNGVTFGIKGVYSLDEMRAIRDKITVASRRFYIDYVRPVDLLGTVFTVDISTQEVQL